MPRKRKLTQAAVRSIFNSNETAKTLGARYGVSQNMIYLIRSGRAHQRLTNGLPARKRQRPGRLSSAANMKIDINALADALLDRIIARLRKR